MLRRTSRTALGAGLLVLAFACGGGGSSSPAPAPSAPSVPTSLAAAGSLRNIRLTWTASTGAGLTGYNVYRSTDGNSFAKLNTAPVAATLYDDAIASPAGDGVVYHYQVTAVGALESAASARVKGLHGTRIPASSSAGFTTLVAGSPYVAEGSVVINGGDLVVDTGTALYVPDGASIDVEQGNGITAGRLYVKGLLRVLAASSAPATFTSHRAGGALANDEGFHLFFDGAVNFNPADGSGTLVQNANLQNLKSVTPGGGVTIRNCAPKLAHCKLTGNSATGTVYILFTQGCGALVQNCLFTKVAPSVNADLRATGFKLSFNRFRGGYYAFYVGDATLAGFNLGQVDSNDFDGTKEAGIFLPPGSATVQIGGNYWNGGTGTPPVPAETPSYATIHYQFSPALTSAPAGAGPNW